MKHTPEPWQQGQLLLTTRTKRYTPELWEKLSNEEKRMVFANFTPLDEGRGRQLIAICQTPEDAARIVACVNYCKDTPNEDLESSSLEALKAERDELLSALQDLFKLAEDLLSAQGVRNPRMEPRTDAAWLLLRKYGEVKP